MVKCGGISCQGSPQEVAASDPDLNNTWKKALEHIEHGSESEEEEGVETVEEERRHLAALCKVNPELKHSTENEVDEIDTDNKSKFLAVPYSTECSWDVCSCE